MTMDLNAATTARFDALWARSVPCSPEGAHRVGGELMRLYAEPHRRFHTLQHIDDCLRRFDEVDALIKHPDAVEIALWFHDAIYVPGAPDNEERSVTFFQRESSGATPAFAARVADLIMATKHLESAQSGDLGFMVDIDLRGFADPWELFMAKGDELRAEHADQSDADYYRAQLRFLGRLENRPFFYCTPYYRSRYEKTAKQNVRRLLELRAREGHTALQPQPGAM